MNLRAEVGLSCEKDGEMNSKLTSPLMAFYTGSSVLDIWQEVAPLLQRAAVWGRGDYAVEDILVLAESGHMQIWTFSEEGRIFLVGVTRIVTHPRRKICEIYALAGSRMFEIWEKFSGILLNWGEQNGASWLEVLCRPSMSRKIQQLGFEPTVQVLAFKRKDPS